MANHLFGAGDKEFWKGIEDSNVLGQSILQYAEEYPLRGRIEGYKT